MGQYGLTEQEVKDELFDMFSDWIRGQTVGIDEMGNANYYPDDLERFKSRLAGVPKITKKFYLRKI